VLFFGLLVAMHSGIVFIANNTWNAASELGQK